MLGLPVAENMHHIIAVFSNKQKVAALAPFVTQARAKYDQNLAAYIRLILRRPLARQLVRPFPSELKARR